MIGLTFYRESLAEVLWEGYDCISAHIDIFAVMPVKLAQQNDIQGLLMSHLK